MAPVVFPLASSSADTLRKASGALNGMMASTPVAAAHNTAEGTLATW